MPLTACWISFWFNFYDFENGQIWLQDEIFLFLFTALPVPARFIAIDLDKIWYAPNLVLWDLVQQYAWKFFVVFHFKFLPGKILVFRTLTNTAPPTLSVGHHFLSKTFYSSDLDTIWYTTCRHQCDYTFLDFFYSQNSCFSQNTNIAHLPTLSVIHASLYPSDLDGY